MKQIQIKGVIIPNDDKWFYDWLEMDATAPRDIVLPETGEDVEVLINSPGGNVYAGSEIYTALRSYSGQVHVKIVGIAASAASVIAMAGNYVEISPTAQIMIHNVSSGTYGDHKALIHEAGVLEGFNESIASSYMAKTGKSLDELLELMGQETWFTAEKAVEHGFADSVMFAKDIVPGLMASQSSAIPSNVIEKMRKAMTPPKLDIDKLAEKVAEKLAIKESKNEEVETLNQGFGRFLF